MSDVPPDIPSGRILREVSQQPKRAYNIPSTKALDAYAQEASNG
jgi:hypothetical protein